MSQREVHHFCVVLAGYGAEAVHPYVALDSLRLMTETKNNFKNINELENKYIKALGKRYF